MKAFVIFRDRVTYARRCVAALTAAGLDVTIADHGSSWPPAITWLLDCEQAGTPVLWRGSVHPRSLWECDEFRDACGSDRYLVTDPDVVPDEGCPADWPAHLSGLLDEFPEFHKAALGLRIDDIPGYYAHRNRVVAWEEKYWADPLGDGAFRALTDTTLAVYRPLTEWLGFTLSGVRTGPPYVAGHLAWYENLDDMDAELRYYHDHAEQGVSFWAPGAPQA